MLLTGLATGLSVTMEIGVGAITVGESVNPCMGGSVVASTGVTIVVGSKTGAMTGAPVFVSGSIGLATGVPVTDCVGGNPDGTMIALMGGSAMFVDVGIGMLIAVGTWLVGLVLTTVGVLVF